ncbi:hypothetical protein ACWIUH_02725 [Ursidibacter arcticus]
MLKTLKVGIISGIVLSLTACVGKDAQEAHKNSIKTPNNEKSGQIVVFAANNKLIGDQSVGISVNSRLIAPLKNQQQFIQGLCTGEYVISAHSISSTSTVKKDAQHIDFTQKINVEKGKTKFLMLDSIINGKTQTWVFKETDEDTWKAQGKLGSANDRLLRRVPEKMMDCK